MVGRAIAGKLVAIGHEAKMGSREAGNEKALAWVAEVGEGASEGSFADAASFGEVVVNATAGAHSLEALEAAGAENLRGKVLIDIGNAMADTQPPTLTVCNTDSLGEQIQRAFPEARVVKTLNTINAGVMVGARLARRDDERLHLRGRRRRQGPGHGAAARPSAGCPATSSISGDIAAARGMEMYLTLWLRLMGATGTAQFNIRIVKD